MKPQTQSTKVKVGIVGGSLVGLSTAIALARLGISSVVFERERHFEAATGIGIDPTLLFKVTGANPHAHAHPLSLVFTHRYTTSWMVLHAWLRHVAAAYPDIQILVGVEVAEVHSGQSEATVTTSSGQRWRFDCIIGADGYRSRIRRWIDRDNPEPMYGGAIIWRGLEPEKTGGDLITESGGAIGTVPEALRLIAYPVPGSDGHQRNINWAWYDSSRLNLLEELGCVRDGVVRRSALHVDVKFLEHELDEIAFGRWSAPWREYVRASLRKFAWFGTPVAEYSPPRLVDGRVAVIGDAAHVAAPVTGAGLSTGLADVLALSSEFKKLSDPSECGAVLRRYEDCRLSAGRRFVADGKMQMARILRPVR